MTSTPDAAGPGRASAIVRGVGWLLILLALAALSYEIAVAFQSGGYRMIAAGELWYTLDRGSLNVVQAITQRYLHPVLWDPVIQSVLTWPAWVLFAVPGVALLAIGRIAGRRWLPWRAARGGSSR